MFITNCIFCKIDLGINTGVCNFCYSILPWLHIVKYKCNRCQKTLSFEEQNTQHEICYNCYSEQENLTKYNIFNKIFAVFSYQDPIKQLILDLKFKQKLSYGKFLGTILSKYIINHCYKHQQLPSTIIPIPLHVERLRKRGFNQAYEIAKYVAKNIKIKINNTACIKIKNTISQMNLIKNKRNTNIKNAFLATKLPDKHIAILDDVITTGSTTKDLCKTIIQENPDINIDIWCICRA